MKKVTRFRSWPCLAVAAALAAPLLHAQVAAVTEDQRPPVVGAGHSYIRDLSETVDPATGALDVTISLPEPAGQRGPAAPLSIVYNSSQYTRVGWSGSLRGDNDGPDSRDGWRYSVPSSAWWFPTPTCSPTAAIASLPAASCTSTQPGKPMTSCWVGTCKGPWPAFAIPFP